MSAKRPFLRFAMLAALAFHFACSDDDGGAPPKGRGTPACNEWQNAYCDLVGRCQGPETACDQIKGIACKSDDDARRCADRVRSAVCGSLPAGCDYTDLVDPAPAQKACDDFKTALCGRNEECQAGSREDCISQLDTTLMCMNAVGVKLSYEQCIGEVHTIACANPATPESCKGVLLF